MREKQVGAHRRDEMETAFSDRFMDWLYRMEQSGLILEGQASIRRENGFFVCRVVAQGADALSENAMNYDARKAFDSLLEASDGPPQVTGVGRSVMPRGCECVKSPYFILYPCAEWEGSPIRCGGCNASFPLYRTKKLGVEREFGEILSWRKTYRGFVAHLTAGGEHSNRNGYGRDKSESYKSLNSCVSEMSLLGRRLAGEVERDTDVLTYYPLYQVHEDIPDACPQCGANWRNPYPAAIRFSHVCPACRLCMGAV